MDFLNKVGETLTATGKEVAKKTKELAEIAALKAQILAKEEETKKNYMEIGKYVYENNREEAPTEVADRIAKIDALKEEIEKLNDDIKNVKATDVTVE